MSEDGFLADLAGQVVVVTGGGRGIGYACARRLAMAGAAVALFDLRPDVAETAAELARETGVRAVGHLVDITDADAVSAALAVVEADLGPAGVLVTAAGIPGNDDAFDITRARLDTVMAVNVTGTLLPAQAFARSCRDGGRSGAIVMVGSISGRIVNVPQRQGAYNASKAAVESLMRSVALEWIEFGVRVNAVSPGYVLTEMTRHDVETMPERVAQWRSRIPAGDLGRPEDVANAVAYLASSASRYVVGQTLVVDGGYTIL
ncbi:MAG: SDR family NAD(P)-dependent oxidoreductase [Janthinobacterium lividum]